MCIRDRTEKGKELVEKIYPSGMLKFVKKEERGKGGVTIL